MSVNVCAMIVVMGAGCSLLSAEPAYRRDGDGLLLPCMSYPQFLERTYGFVLKRLDNGWATGNAYKDQDGKPVPSYINYALANPERKLGVGHPRNADTVYPAFHHALFIRAFLAQWRYTGDAECLARARQLADWNLARRTPADCKYGSLFYSTVHKGQVGGNVDGDAIMTDKPAIMALAMLELSEATGDARYRQAAEAVAATLAKTQLPEGNWPFRVNPRTGQVREAYTSSAIYALMLFEELGRGDHGRWAEAKAKTLEWILEGPVKTMRWNGFYEDITRDMGKENRTNWDCIDTARWLVAHRADNPEYLTKARRLHDWIAKEFVEKSDAWAPAEGLREQKVCFATMGIHTAHWAALLADLHAATGEGSFKQRALSTCALVTYWMRDDGVNLVGPSWSPGNTWFSCHFGPALYLYDTLTRFPGLLTAGQPLPATGTTYYVSRSSGNDNWTGLIASPNGGTGPWKTLARASTNYVAGDRILLKCGDTWNEELHPTGDGTPSNPITICSYGEGPRPCIDRLDATGNNIAKVCIHLKNTAGYKIQGIEFARFGRGVFADLDKGVHGKDYLWIEDCLFRDAFYYNCTGWYTADIPSDGGTGPNYIFDVGIWIQTRETADIICLSNITIKDCHFKHVACAINAWSGNEWDKTARGRHEFQNLVIDRCTAEDGKNWQFVLHGTQGGRIANSWVHRVGFHQDPVPNGIAGAMLFRCKDITVENCEFGYVSMGTAKADGVSFDYEGDCENIVARNCLYHDTEGPGFLFCWGASADTPNRGCVFENCVFDCKETKAPNPYPARYAFINDSGRNTATFDKCRFYMSEGEILADRLEGLVFINCSTNKPNARYGANRAIGATASASSSDLGAGPANATDGKASTAWRSGPARSAGEWLQIDFGGPTEIDEVVLKEAPSSTINRYAIQYWDDAKSVWRDCYQGSSIGPSLKAAFVGITAPKVRLNILSTVGGSPAIGEVEAYLSTSATP